MLLINCPQVVTLIEKFVILLLHRYLHLQQCLTIKKTSKGQKPKHVSVSRTIAEIICCNEKTVKQIWHNYVNGIDLEQATVAANYDAKQTRVPNAKEVVSKVQEFVRQRQLTRTCTIAKDVVLFLQDQNYITVNKDNKADYK